MDNIKKKSDQDWQAILSEKEYKVCREKGTEPAFTGEYNDFKEKGVFLCKCCQKELFSSDHKYDSSSGWPSFFKAIDEESVKEHNDTSHNMTRTEITCSNCDSHLGHIFSDGPNPTGLRYCVNSISLKFKEK